jgi:hypothetical protein
MGYKTNEEVLLDAIRENTAATNIDITASVDGLEALQTSTNAKLDIIEATLTAIETDIAAVESLLTTQSGSIDKMHTNAVLEMGNSGSVTISGAAAQSGSAGTYWAVYFISATTPTQLDIDASTTVTGVTYPAGTWLYGDIRAITGDASGLYTLYKGNPA